MPARVPCLLAALLLATAQGGCSRDRAGADGQKRDGTLQTVADGITGRTAIEAGQHARDEIERIADQRDRELEAVLGD